MSDETRRPVWDERSGESFRVTSFWPNSREEVERCFVHIDYQSGSQPKSEEGQGTKISIFWMFDEYADNKPDSCRCGGPGGGERLFLEIRTPSKTV